MIRPVVGALVALFLLSGMALASAATLGAHYIPQAGDHFVYAETSLINSGTGNYTGYDDATFVNGTIGVTAINTNQTESAAYSNSDHWFDNTGRSQQWSSSGSFTFSARTYLYVQGTDNQTGYVNPYVWFYMNSSLAAGRTFYLLNTGMTLVSNSTSFALALSSTGYVRTLFGEGNGSYHRNDAYGKFTATYNWMAYFDPGTGYIVGYVYTEQDSDAAGDGFTVNDVLKVTSTSYALTPAAAPSPPPPGNSTPVLLLGVVIAVIVIVVVAIIAALLLRSRRRRSLPKHSGPATVPFTPTYSSPPPIDLTRGGQPAVQQIVVRETVKVKCRYCGALVDPSGKACPNCGAPLG